MSSQQEKSDFLSRLYVFFRDIPPFTWAKKVGIPKSTFYKISRGETQPSMSQLQQIAKIEGVSLDWLIDGVGPMYRKGKDGIYQFPACDHEGLLSRKGHMFEEAKPLDLELLDFIYKEVARYTEEKKIKLTKEEKVDVIFFSYNFCFPENKPEAETICYVVQKWLNMTEDERQEHT